MGTLRLLQIGVGGFGRSWLKTIRQNPGVELVGAVDVSEKNLLEAKEIMDNPALPTFFDHREALRSVEADAAVIVTPPRTHLSIATDALEAGLHVFMEKPITYSFEEAKRFYGSYEAYGRKVMVNQNYRWTREIQAVKRAIESGAIGDIGYIDWNFRRMHVPRQGTWREHSPDFLFTDVSIHHFDLLRYFLGAEPVRIQAHGMRPPWSWCEGNMVGGAVFEFPGGITAYYFGSLEDAGTETTWNGDVRIVGKDGAIELIRDVPVWVKSDRSVEPLPLPEMEYTSQSYSLHEFVRSVRSDTTPVTDLKDNVKSHDHPLRGWLDFSPIRA